MERNSLNSQGYKLESQIREEYVSLLTDFEMLEADEIMSKRDKLQERTAEVIKQLRKH